MAGPCRSPVPPLAAAPAGAVGYGRPRTRPTCSAVRRGAAHAVAARARRAAARRRARAMRTERVGGAASAASRRAGTLLARSRAREFDSRSMEAAATLATAPPLFLWRQKYSFLLTVTVRAICSTSVPHPLRSQASLPCPHTCACAAVTHARCAPGVLPPSLQHVTLNSNMQTYASELLHCMRVGVVALPDHASVCGGDSAAVLRRTQRRAAA